MPFIFALSDFEGGFQGCKITKKILLNNAYWA